ncbi:MAG: hypothetical protein MK101_11195 [Phycisphaerales bacterium]|nr:hypothetical protein [Phycisphaerales bacterium]
MASIWYGLPESPPSVGLPMVLLEHKQRGVDPHLDWFVARNPLKGPLAAWRLPSWPAAGERVSPLEVGVDHDREWLTRQGALRGDRGSAIRIDEGLMLGWALQGEAAGGELRWRGGGDQTLLIQVSGSALSLERLAL